MKTVKTLLAAAILSLVAFAGYSQAQTATTTGTVVLTPEQVLSGSATALATAKDWNGLIALAQPFITGNCIYDPGVNGWTDAQYLNNQAIGYLITGTSKLAGVQAGHDYAVSKLAWEAAANITLGSLRNPTAAIVELQNALSLQTVPRSQRGTQARLLLYRAKAGLNVNADIMAFLGAQTTLIDLESAGNLYAAFNYPQAAKADIMSFYGLLLQSVESNQGNAAFIGKILDQENKLNK